MNLPLPPLASLVLAGLLTAPPGVLAAPPYEADWASLDQRPLPGWFNEAKVGIFICWGPYSVPAWAPKGKYAEWYGKRAQENTPWKSYHEKNYGKEFKYEQFAPMMTGAQFDPDEWAELIANSGAKYTAFAVNYHDGFAMWPTKFAMTPNTREWNAAVTGPKRNVTGELKTAFEKQDVKFGIYYSVYEWWHPLMKNKEEYALQWFHPKFKEVVSTYQPWFIFLDGEWSADHETWHSEELAAWLYNDSPVRDTVVTNDRWGKTRGKHGDIFSSEYGGGKGFGGHPWQEDRGIGSSYGYNRNEDLADYNSPYELIEMLTRITMNGGNFLLDIGPAADGRIPTIMQERLLQMGAWLKVNGEAIYGTTRWTVQDEGTRTGEIAAVRYTTRGDDVFAICTRWPGTGLVLKAPKPATGSKIALLGHDGAVAWTMQDGQLVIDVPQLTIDQLPCEHMWVFRIPGAASSVPTAVD